MTTDIKDALTDIAETNCNIIGLTCAAAVDYIEQLEAKLSTQSAEPAAWMNPNESFAPDAFIWNEDDIHPEYSVPVFTHPAKTEQPPQNCREAGPGKGLCDQCASGRYERCQYVAAVQTEQPSLSDHQLNYVQECIERAKLLPVWDNVPHSLHAELDNIFRGVALLSAQRQDSDKDAERLDWLLDWYLRDGLRAEIDPIGHIRRTTKEIILAAIDRAIANGAPK